MLQIKKALSISNILAGVFGAILAAFIFIASGYCHSENFDNNLLSSQNIPTEESNRIAFFKQFTESLNHSSAVDAAVIMANTTASSRPPLLKHINDSILDYYNVVLPCALSSLADSKTRNEIEMFMLVIAMGDVQEASFLVKEYQDLGPEDFIIKYQRRNGEMASELNAKLYN